MSHNFFKPYFFEIFAGPMKSGKTKMLVDRLDKLDYLKDINYIVLRPEIDTRDSSLTTRFGTIKKFDSIYVPFNNMNAIYDILYKSEDKYDVVAFDELQFFEEGIDNLIEEMVHDGKYVIGAGLNLDFRGEPFGQMDKLMTKAQSIKIINGICDYPGCNNASSRTQRLINGKPADYNSPINVIDGSGDEVYETRCIIHHLVPGKKTYFN